MLDAEDYKFETGYWKKVKSFGLWFSTSCLFNYLIPKFSNQQLATSNQQPATSIQYPVSNPRALKKFEHQ